MAPAADDKSIAFGPHIRVVAGLTVGSSHGVVIEPNILHRSIGTGCYLRDWFWN